MAPGLKAPTTWNSSLVGGMSSGPSSRFFDQESVIRCFVESCRTGQAATSVPPNLGYIDLTPIAPRTSTVRHDERRSHDNMLAQRTTLSIALILVLAGAARA